MRLKSDQAPFILIVAESRTADISTKLRELTSGSAFCRKLAQFLLAALVDEHQVVSSMFIRRGIDALFRVHFSTLPKLVLCRSDGYGQWQRQRLEQHQGME